MQLKPAPVFPDMDSNYQATVVIPQQEAAKAAQDALDAQAALAAQVAAQPVESSYVAPTQFVDGLIGSIGYALAAGNCVLEVPVALRGEGNPIEWAATTQTPYIGGAVLFYYNHTARITGLWSNGDIEIAQQNWSGPAQTRFPRSSFRGFR